METIDDLPFESNSTSGSKLSLSPLNFRLLLATICADRFAYYGLRSVIILYAIDQFGLTRLTALDHYFYLTLIVYISQLFGGFLGDFLLGARNGMLVGLGLCVLGSLVISIENSYVFYTGLFLIATGAGFFRTNTFSLISHYSAHDKNLLQKRFVSMYAFVNLGALLNSFVVAVIGEKFGYIYSFLIVLLLYALSTALMFTMSNRKNTSEVAQRELSPEPKPIAKSLLVIIVVTISSAVFWMLFEKYSMQISRVKIDFVYSNTSEFIVDYIWAFPAALILLLSIPYYFLANRISKYVKLAISMILIGICWGAGALLFDSELFSFGYTALIIFMLMEGIADIFVTPAALTLLTIHTSKKYYGIIFALYSLILYLGGRVISYSDSYYYEVITNVILFVLLIASIVLYFVLPSILPKKNSPNTSLEEEI